MPLPMNMSGVVRCVLLSDARWAIFLGTPGRIIMAGRNNQQWLTTIIGGHAVHAFNHGVINVPAFESSLFEREDSEANAYRRKRKISTVNKLAWCRPGDGTCVFGKCITTSLSRNCPLLPRSRWLYTYFTIFGKSAMMGYGARGNTLYLSLPSKSIVHKKAPIATKTNEEMFEMMRTWDKTIFRVRTNNVNLWI